MDCERIGAIIDGGANIIYGSNYIKPKRSEQKWNRFMEMYTQTKSNML